jgi:Family of unknown function (DUF5681)
MRRMIVEEENKVGYGKPPLHSRFVKGRSGNPKGRPKRARSVNTELLEVLFERVTIREGDRTRKVTKLRALIESVFAKPFKGDSRAAVNLLSLIVRQLGPDRVLNPEPVNLDSGPAWEPKELTPEEKWDWVRQVLNALKEVKGLPSAARRALDEEGKDSAS